jgi:two-component system sensor histidine kinase MtrB
VKRPFRLSFRARLLAAFVAVAFGTGALLVGTSYIVVRRYRETTFARQAEREARLGVLGPTWPMTGTAFRSYIATFTRGRSMPVVGVDRGRSFSSFSSFDVTNVPAELRGQGAVDDPAHADVHVRGEPFRVVAVTPAPGQSVYFFFSQRRFRESIGQTGRTLVLGWFLAVITSIALGAVATRRALRPVRWVADAAGAIASGAFDTRLDVPPGDELGSLSASFNSMADSIGAKIDELAAIAERERRLTADVAHDLRTPLTSIITAVSLIEERRHALDPETARAVELIDHEARRLRALTVDLLELARLDAGGPARELEPLELGPALGAALAPWAASDRLSVVIDGSPAVLADPVGLRRIIDNLVGNAMKHTDADVEVHALVDGGEGVIRVLDRGPGIPPGDQHRLFRRFYKPDASRSVEGSGLGLAIAAEHARAMGGGISARNRPGGGAAFELRLQRSAAPSGAAADAPAGVMT